MRIRLLGHYRALVLPYRARSNRSGYAPPALLGFFLLRQVNSVHSDVHHNDCQSGHPLHRAGEVGAHVPGGVGDGSAVLDDDVQVPSCLAPPTCTLTPRVMSFSPRRARARAPPRTPWRPRLPGSGSARLAFPLRWPHRKIVPPPGPSGCRGQGEEPLNVRSRACPLLPLGGVSRLSARESGCRCAGHWGSSRTSSV